MSFSVRARMVLPVSRPPIDDGVIQVNGDRIVWCGRWADRPGGFDERVVDLGDQIVLPGLINAHCHLDYTGMAGSLSPPRHFTDWIKGLMALKSAWSTDDFAESWVKGAEMLLQTGTTTVADVEAMPELLPRIWDKTPLRVISFRELIHLRPGESREVVARAAEKCQALPDHRLRIGLSPHAPYSTTADLLENAAEAAGRHGWRLMTHVAESEEEFEMFMYRQGSMFDWLKGQRDMADCGLGSPVQHLERYGYLSENLIAVHVNHLWRHDAGLLGRNQVSVVHCPRSHAYFRHLKFPREELERAGVNLCLGTDSLASVLRGGGPAELNLFSEMQALLQGSPQLSPEAVLRMATINAAQALGRGSDLGELASGALADLISIQMNGPGEDPWETAVHFRGTVGSSLIGGRWAIGPASNS